MSNVGHYDPLVAFNWTNFYETRETFFQIIVKIVELRWAMWDIVVLLLHLIEPTFMKLQKLLL